MCIQNGSCQNKKMGGEHFEATMGHFRGEIDNIVVIFSKRVFQKTVGIPMDTKCASLLTDLSFHSYEAELLHGLPRKTKRS